MKAIYSTSSSAGFGVRVDGGGVPVTGRAAAALMATPQWDADEAVTQLYAVHYTSLVRLSTLLLRDSHVAEEVTQDAFVAMHAHWRRMRDPDKALAYLRRTVVNRSRSVLRHRTVVAKHNTERPGETPGADAQVLDNERRAEIMRALQGLSGRQRETLVLRYYLDMSEADIASTLNISRGAVKSHAARGIAALRKALEH